MDPGTESKLKAKLGRLVADGWDLLAEYEASGVPVPTELRSLLEPKQREERKKYDKTKTVLRRIADYLKDHPNSATGTIGAALGLRPHVVSSHVDRKDNCHIFVTTGTEPSGRPHLHGGVRNLWSLKESVENPPVSPGS